MVSVESLTAAILFLFVGVPNIGVVIVLIIVNRPKHPRKNNLIKLVLQGTAFFAMVSACRTQTPD